MAKAAEQLQDLWDKMKSEGNCTDYVNEMCTQLKLLGTETNTLTKLMVKEKVKALLMELELAE